LCEIRDPGEGFTLGSLPQAAISNPPDGPFDRSYYVPYRAGMRPGGFGIPLTRNRVDELLSEKGNQVALIEYLHGFRQP